MKIKISNNCKFDAKSFQQRLKSSLSSRVDKFFTEVDDAPKTHEEWMKEFFYWSRNNMWKKEQELLYDAD